MTRVKICGIRQPDHALAVAQAGADYIGLVFVPNRRRRLTVQAARTIVAELKSSFAVSPQVVGLFADQPLEEVVHTVQACRLDAVQLCGRESLDYCGQMPVPVIKVLHVPDASNPSACQEELFPPDIEKGPVGVSPFEKGGSGGISTPARPTGEDNLESFARQVGLYREAGHLVTLDRLVDGLQGGTGRSFDWEIAAWLSRQGHSFLLAGGLDPDNVAQAIDRVQPWGVDVSSGVETQGVKDPEKIRAFIRNARSPQQHDVQE